jgi:hypothetical protein
MEHATWIKATAHLHVLAQMLTCPLLARSRTSRPQHATNARTIYTVLRIYGFFFMCGLLGSMVAYLLVPCTSRERSRDMVHYNCLDSLTAGLKQTTAFSMIVNLYHDFYQGIWAGSVALPRSLSWLTLVLSTLPIPPWLGPGASDRAQHLALQAPTSRQAKKMFGALCDGRGRERVLIHASAAESTAPHSPSKMSPLPRLPL